MVVAVDFPVGWFASRGAQTCVCLCLVGVGLFVFCLLCWLCRLLFLFLLYGFCVLLFVVLEMCVCLCVCLCVWLFLCCFIRVVFLRCFDCCLFCFPVAWFASRGAQHCLVVGVCCVCVVGCFVLMFCC